MNIDKIRLNLEAIMPPGQIEATIRLLVHLGNTAMSEQLVGMSGVEASPAAMVTRANFIDFAERMPNWTVKQSPSAYAVRIWNALWRDGQKIGLLDYQESPFDDNEATPGVPNVQLGFGSLLVAVRAVEAEGTTQSRFDRAVNIYLGTNIGSEGVRLLQAFVNDREQQILTNQAIDDQQ